MEVDLTPKKPGGVFAGAFCSSRHPKRDDVWCRRQKNHDGACCAFAFSIAVPDEWERPQ